MSTGNTRKRPAPERPDIVSGGVDVQLPPPAKNQREIPDPEESSEEAPSAQQQVPPPAPAAQVIKRNPYVIYPDQYAEFDKSRIIFSKDPVQSTEGGGMLLFMQYLFSVPDPATGTVKSVPKPLCINTPNGMHMPKGITLWKDGKSSALLSLGRDWESIEVKIAFRKLVDDIINRCNEVIAEKSWNSPFPNTKEAIQANFTPFLFCGMSENGEQYPPSFKASVIVSSKSGPLTEVYEYSDKLPLPALLPTEVPNGSAASAIVHITWVYRKKAGSCFKYSLRANMVQAVVEKPTKQRSSGGAQEAPVCSVSF